MFSGCVDKISKGLNYFFLPFENSRYFGDLVRLVFSQRSLPRELIHLQQYQKWFRKKSFKTIIDVGANTGPFAFAARVLLADSQIYAFEPLPECYQKLNSNLSPYGHFSAFQSAIGNQRGEMEMWKSDFTESSSLLPMDDLHKKAFPHTANQKVIKVPISKLDDYLEKMHLLPPVLLKIDVQGYEDQVILGATRIMQQVDSIMIEMSFQPLYQGQPLFDEIYQLLISKGFTFAGNMDGLFSPLDGSILQSDGIFNRS